MLKIHCDRCGQEIKGRDFFTSRPGMKKKVMTTISLNGSRHCRIYLRSDSDLQIRLSLDTYVTNSNNADPEVHLHWSCLTKLTKKAVTDWAIDVWDHEEELRDA